MRKLLKISVLLMVVVLTFSSCKKDEMSIEKSELALSGKDDINLKLNYYQPDLEIRGKIAPEDAVDGKVTIKVTSDADPTGFEFTLDLTDGSYVDGKTKYLYKSFYGTIYAANHTDADGKRIKVGATDGKITVTVGNNLASDNYSVSSDQILSKTYWANDDAASIFIYNYEFDGSENLSIEAWTHRDNTPITIDMKYSDPAAHQGLPKFNSYNYTVKFKDAWSNQSDTSLGTYHDIADTVFIKYNNKTYYSVYKESTSAPLLEFK